MPDSFVNDKGSLEERVNLFNRMALPGQPLGMHMGTSYLVNDLMREVQELREALKPATEIVEVLDRHLSDDWVPVQTSVVEALQAALAKLEGSGA